MSRFYEYRRYETPNGRMEELKRRFSDVTLPMWEQAGIRPAGFFESRVGQFNVLHYLLEWDSLDERERIWEAFRVDPAWVAAREASEANGPIVTRIDNEIWVPTDFSPLR